MIYGLNKQNENTPYLVWTDFLTAAFQASTMAICIKPIALEGEKKKPAKSYYENMKQK